MCAEYDQRMSKAVEVVRRYTRLTSTFANLSSIRFTHLGLLRRNPFEPLGLRVDLRGRGKENIGFAGDPGALHKRAPNVD